REQLADRKRLGDVVVGAGVERGDLLSLVSHGGHDDDRRIAPLPQLARDLSAAAVGKDEVEDERVGAPEAGGGERRCGSGRGLDVVPGPAQVRRKRTEDLRFVVDDEHARLARGHAHRACSTATGPAGRSTPASAPPPSRGASVNDPPFAAAKPLAIARPSPAPRTTARPRANGSQNPAARPPGDPTR